MAELDPEQLRKLVDWLRSDLWNEQEHVIDNVAKEAAAAILTLLDRLEALQSEMGAFDPKQDSTPPGHHWEALVRQRDALKTENAELQKRFDDAVAPTVGPAAARPELEALRNLVDTLTNIEADESFKGIWGYLHIHGYEYTGPNWQLALENAKAALRGAAARADSHPASNPNAAGDVETHPTQKGEP